MRPGIQAPTVELLDVSEEDIQEADVESEEEKKLAFPQVDDIFDERILTDPQHQLSSLH